MKIGLRIKLNVKKIEKARLFVGKEGTYLDATVFVDVDNKDQYKNNGMITQDVSKEEREQGVKGNILGNVQVFFRDESDQAGQAHDQGINKAQQAANFQAPKDFDFDDDIAF